MFEEAQLYAPVTRSAKGDVTVHLSDNHPGAVDPEYRARRNALATLDNQTQPALSSVTLEKSQRARQSMSARSMRIIDCGAAAVGPTEATRMARASRLRIEIGAKTIFRAPT